MITMNFRTVTLEDKQLITKYIEQMQPYGAEYSFMNIYLWGEYYDVKMAEEDDTLFLVSNLDKENMAFAYPMTKNPKAAIEKLMAFVKEKGRTLTLYGVTEKVKEELEQLFPEKFVYTEDRDVSDYIYNSVDLMELKGKKYHGKRNHINKFVEKEWSYESISKENMDECREMNRQWCIENEVEGNESKEAEQKMIQKAFEEFEELGLKGGLISQEGKVVAFTFGEKLSEDVFVVHVEKAFYHVQGAYPIVNREFVRHEASQFKYINREEDLGIEGLRKAKLSYYPEIILTKYEAKMV